MSHIATRDFARNGTEARYPNLWNGLVGAWCPSMGLKGITTIHDFSLYRVNATTAGTMNSADFVAGKTGQALDFDGTDDALEVADRAELSPDVSFTIATWIRFNSIAAGTTQMIVSKDSNSGAGTREFQISYASSGTAFTFLIFENGSTSVFTQVQLTALGTPVAGTWYLLVARKNVDDGTISIYANGQKNSVASTRAPVGSASVRFARLGGGTTLPFNGRMQDWFIWRRHLSDSEVGSLYSGAHPLEKKRASSSFRVPSAGITLTALPAISTWVVNNGAIVLGSTIVLSASPAIAIWTTLDGVMNVAGNINLTATPAISTWFALNGAISIPGGAIVLTSAPAIFTWVVLSGTIPGGPITLTTTPSIFTWVANDGDLVFNPCYSLTACELSLSRFKITEAPPK